MTSSLSGSGESIADRLLRLRRERGLSQRQLAEPGVTAAYISRIEAGARTPSIKALRMLARKLAVSAEYLETGLDVGEGDLRELRLADAELELRLTDDVALVAPAFRALLDEATAAPDAEIVARARLGLGLAAARAGDHREAVAQLDQALGSGPLSPASQPDGYVTLARSYVALAMPRRAVQVLEDALDEVRRTAPADRVARVRFTTALAVELAEVGELDRARDVVRGSLSLSDEPVSPLTRVRLHWDRGRAAAEGGDARAALIHLRRALGLLEATDEILDLARAHLYRAELLVEDDEVNTARTELERAEELLGPRPAPEDLARLRAEQASRAMREGSFDRAVDCTREALGLLGESEPAQRARLLHVLADALLARGEVDSAFEAYGRSVALYGEVDRLHEAAAVARDWGHRLRLAGRETEALDVLERSAVLATRAGSGSRRPPRS